MKIPELIIFILLIINIPVNCTLENVKSLTSNFFMNLNKLHYGEILDEETKEIIDKQIDHYVEMVEKTHGIIFNSKQRRSAVDDDFDILSKDFIGVYVLNGFFGHERVPVINPIDIALFNHEFENQEMWYASTLESINGLDKAENLILYRFENDSYVQIVNVSVSNGIEIATYTKQDTTYIIVLESQGATVYLFDLEENLYKIQTLNINNPISITIWPIKNNIYLTITQEMIETPNGPNYEFDTPIYKWTEKEFQIDSHIKTYSARKITPFVIGEHKFLAVANFKNNKGETDIFSEIYKYNIINNNFESYQKILTHAAVDIKYFCFKKHNRQEVFLIIANSYEIDNGEINYETNSIVYKFVEDYFMPFQSFKLHSAELWLPVAGPSGEFLLLSACKNTGVKSFQYDGWRFVESEVQYTGDAFGAGVKTMQTYWYKTHQLIVVANENDYGNMPNVFYPTFNYQNAMDDFQKGMHEWCEQTFQDLEAVDLDELEMFVDEAPKIDDAEVQLNGSIYFHNVNINTLVLNNDEVEFTENRMKRSSDYSYLEEQIDAKADELEKFYERLQNENEPIVINSNVHVKTLEIDSDKIVFKDLHAETINNIDIDKFYNDIYFLDNPFEIEDNIRFEDVLFEGFTTPKYVNNIPIKNLITTSLNVTRPDVNLLVDGNVTVKHLIVGGYVDGLLINENKILLTEGDQILQGNLRVTNADVENLEINYINNIDTINFDKKQTIYITEQNVDTLSVKNIKIDKINGMDMHSLQKLVLRTNGDQNITGNYEIDTLIVDDFEITGPLSNTDINNVAKISNATNFLEQSIIFTEDIQVEHFHVVERLQQIPVIKGKLDVLLKDHRNVQYITGIKTFDTINLSGPIQLRGQIKTQGLEPPIIRKNLTLEGDFVIDGNMIIENSLKFTDLAEPTGTYSMERLEKQGLKLTDKEIPIHLNFTKGLTVDEIEVETINNININSWIRFEDEISEISGQKIFENDLNINGELIVKSINGYNLKKLYNNILKKKGDQIIKGHHQYFKVTLVRAVSNATYLNNVPWSNVMTIDGDQFIDGTTTLLQPTNMSHFEAESAILRGKLLNFDFDAMVTDTLFNNSNKIITGKKYFEQPIIFQNLKIDSINDINLQGVLNQIDQWIGDVYINGSLEIKNPITVKNIQFGDLNDLSNKDFGKIWLLSEGDQMIHKDQYFENAIFKSNVFIDSHLVNDINLKEIDENAVKVNENYKFNSAQFVNPVTSEEAITVSGKLKNIDISDIILSEGIENQTITGTKTFKNNLTINGLLYVNGLLTGVNLTLLEFLTDPTRFEKNLNLVIDGNINFKNDFNVEIFNGYNITEMYKNAWFTDRKTKIQGFISFDKIIFEDELTVDGYVDDIELVWLSKNYFSKTKDQKITAKLDFIDGIECKKNFFAEKAQISGLVSNMSIEDFGKKVLRNTPQTFDFPIQFDDLEVTKRLDAKLINNLNLQTDVLRYDVKENIVTGFKTIRNLNVLDLDIPKGVKIQNVDIDNWFRNIVTVNGTFTIDGLKTLKNSKFEKNVEVKGFVNSYKFDEENVLTTHTKQKITGKKTFTTSGDLINSTLSFDILKIKGLFNDIDFNTLMEQQIDKNKEVIHISAIKHFYNTISADNVIFKQGYQGIDINELFKNLTSLHKVNTYDKEYARLMDFAKDMLRVMKRQPYYVKSFTTLQKFNTKVQVVMTIIENNIPVLVFIKIEDKFVRITTFNWNENSEDFTFKQEYDIKSNNKISYASSIFYNNKSHLYVEEENTETTDFQFLGLLYDLSVENKNKINFVLTNKSNSITYFKIPNDNINCLANLQQEDNKLNINCESTESILELYQQLNMNSVFKVLSLEVESIPYLFIITEADETTDSSVNILKYNEETSLFIDNQILKIPHCSSLDAIYYKGSYYLAVGVRHVVDVEISEIIIIYKYENTGEFKEWQKINVMDPIEIKFNVLTTDELVLYVTSTCPSEPFLVFKYEGIAKFQRSFVFSTLPVLNNIYPFTIQNTDFVSLYNEREIRIIKAVFVGKKTD